MAAVLPINPYYLLIAQYEQQGIPYEQAVVMASHVLSYNYNAPLYVQYITYISNIFRGNLGTSILFGRPVIYVIASNLPYTLFLVIASLLFSFAIGTLIGLGTALKKGTKLEALSYVINTLLLGMPNYLIAILLVYAFVWRYPIFPTGSYSIQPSLSIDFLGNLLYHYTLPILTFILVLFPGFALSIRAVAVSQLNSDYVKYAELRGIKNSRILLNYVGKNSILPTYTVVPILLGNLFVGAVFIETIFHLNGAGEMILEAISAKDIPAMMGFFNIIILTIIVGNYVADITYSLIDPRIRVGERT